MGLSEPALVTPREKILDPRTGKPAGGSDPFFSRVNSEVAHKGFPVAAADDLIHGSLRPAGRQTLLGDLVLDPYCASHPTM